LDGLDERILTNNCQQREGFGKDDVRPTLR